MNLSRSLRLICLTVAAVCAVSIAAALTASAYIDRGSVRISDPGTLTLKVGESTQMTVTPAEEAHYPGCQMAECPKVCGEKDCIVMVNGQMECTCKGTEPVTYKAVVDPHSSDSSVATVEYDDKGSVVISAVGEGTAQISVCADFREYQTASKTVVMTVEGKADGEITTDPVDGPDTEMYSVSLTPEEEGHALLTANKKEAKEGDPVMITATASSGYKLQGIKVTDEKEEVIKTKGSGGIYEFTMPASNVTVTPVVSEIQVIEPKEFPFTDVAEDKWSRNAVEFVFNRQLFNGTSETLFSPELTMTRGMLVTVLYRLDGSPDISGDLPFKDVAPGAYYANPVLWASDKGIVKGIDEETFDPEAMISREQMVTIMYRYTEFKGYSTEIKGTLQDYSDDNRLISSYALTPFKWAVTRGIITGVSPTSLAPQGSATREQVAAVMMRFVNKFADA